MSKLEKRLFYLLLNRWAKRNDFTLNLPSNNGIVCLTKDYHLQVRKWRRNPNAD